MISGVTPGTESKAPNENPWSMAGTDDAGRPAAINAGITMLEVVSPVLVPNTLINTAEQRVGITVRHEVPTVEKRLKIARIQQLSESEQTYSP